MAAHGARRLLQMIHNLDAALTMIERWASMGQAKSVGLLGNAADIIPELLRRGIRPDIVTDQTSAHDPLLWLFTTRMDITRMERKAKKRT